MKNEDYAEFEEIMKRAALLTFQQRGKDWLELIITMFEELIKYDLGRVRAAVRDHVRTEKFFPALADVVKRIEGSGSERAATAWATVVRAVSRIGRSNSVAFPAPAYVYAIEQMGGWINLCRTLTTEEEKWRGKDFEQLFQIGERVAVWDADTIYKDGTVRVPMYCVGEYEINNKRRGYALPDIINAESGKALPNFRSTLPAPTEKFEFVLELEKKMRIG
jgi:hypothetical protein